MDAMGISTTYAFFFPHFFPPKKTCSTNPDSRSRSRAEAGDPHPKGLGWLNIEAKFTRNLWKTYGNS